jgi:hypothetical protein
MGNIVVPTSKRISQIEAMTKQAATAADVQAAKADFIAMMCDVDLSMIEDDEEGMEDGTQQEV